MSLMGIDVGTTGCKAAVFTEDGQLLASAYREYDYRKPHPGWAEWDATEVWHHIKQVIRRAAQECAGDPIEALAVSSLGEALVPVTADREILGPSILNFDRRGEAFVDGLRERVSPERLYRINGNLWGNHYSLTKLIWLKTHQRSLYERADYFLLWGSFVPFMLGADPVVDSSLANRTMLFDLETETWSKELLGLADIDAGKLPRLVASGTVIGTVSAPMAEELGLPRDVSIVCGAHDQCATALGCGVIDEGRAVCGMGTFTCITPVFGRRRDTSAMLEQGLNTEHHAVPGKYVSFLYNQGGSIVKWFRDTFAGAEKQALSGPELYGKLFAEMPDGPSVLLVLPHFALTGPPGFIADSSGVIIGLKLDTPRGAVLKGILEGTMFYLRECVESLPKTEIEITSYRAVGGGSRADRWLQLCADIIGRPFTRPRITEAGALGAAIIAGVGTGRFPSYRAGIAAMVEPDRTFEPDEAEHRRYQGKFEHFKQLWPSMKAVLQAMAPPAPQ